VKAWVISVSYSFAGATRAVDRSSLNCYHRNIMIDWKLSRLSYRKVEWTGSAGCLLKELTWIGYLDDSPFWNHTDSLSVFLTDLWIILVSMVFWLWLVYLVSSFAGIPLFLAAFVFSVYICCLRYVADYFVPRS